MGQCGSCSCDFSWVKDIIDDIKNFFEDAGKKIEDFFEMLWGDAKWAYYVTKDLILVAGPFLGFFLYSLLTREEVVINSVSYSGGGY
jgi:hypothetical protein